MKIYTVLSRDTDFIHTTTDEGEAEFVRKEQERDEEMRGGRPSVYIRESEVKTTLEKIQEIASDEPSPWLEEAKQRLRNRQIQKAFEDGRKYEAGELELDTAGRNTAFEVWREENEIDKFSEGYGQGLEHGDAQAKIETPDDIREFVGKAQYDDHGQYIFRQVQDDGSVQMFLDVRGWGAIQHMGFKTEQEAMNFQDRVGRWVAEVINNNLK